MSWKGLLLQLTMLDRGMEGAQSDAQLSQGLELTVQIQPRCGYYSWRVVEMVHGTPSML